MSNTGEREKIRVALLYRGPQHQGKDDFSSFVPMGLFNVLKSLRLAGYAASLHNLSRTPGAGLAKSLAGFEADAFLISAFFGCHHEAYTLARLAKKVSPRAPVVLGGPLSVLGPEILGRVAEIDYVIRGEGEEAGVALLDALYRGKGRPEAIPGVVCRGPSGIIATPPRLLGGIDRFFFLPSEVMPHCRGVRPENLAVLISSRGCPFHCAFCSSTVLWQNRVRHHAVPLLISYLKDLRKSTGAIYFSLRDENFLAGRTHVEEFTAALQESRLHYLWNAQASPRFIDETLARRLAAAGCDQVQMGIEAVSPRLRAFLGKHDKAENIPEAIRLLRRQAIRPFGYFIYGMGESESEGKESLDFIHRAGLLDAVASPLALYPGTGLAEGVNPARFFDKGEILLHSPDSAGKWRNRYRRALAGLHEQGGFSREELTAGPGQTTVRAVARYFRALAENDQAGAERILTTLAGEEPDNPWSFNLLAGFYEERGKAKKAAAMRGKLQALTGF